MRLDIFATEPHYAKHSLPVWFALSSEERGSFCVGRRPDALRAIQDIEARTGLPSGSDDHPVLVAGYSDLRRVPPGRPVVLLEHGAGQTYLNLKGEPDRNPSNPGGTHRKPVALYLCPSQQVADANLAAYPDARAAVVGVPKMDRWHVELEGGPRSGQARSGSPGSGWDGPGSARLGKPRHGQERCGEAGPVICTSFHWHCNQAPEAGTAFPFYASGLPALRDVSRETSVLGHAHPRAWRRLRPFYERIGFEPVEDFDDVLARRPDLYICDNSSTMYEAASVGIPVLALNSPRYRRDIHHGLRFWSHVPGLQVDEPAELAEMVVRALADPPEAQVLRRRAVERAYAHVDGRAAERAARAIREVFG